MITKITDEILVQWDMAEKEGDGFDVGAEGQTCVAAGKEAGWLLLDSETLGVVERALFRDEQNGRFLLLYSEHIGRAYAVEVE